MQVIAESSFSSQQVEKPRALDFAFHGSACACLYGPIVPCHSIGDRVENPHVGGSIPSMPPNENGSPRGSRFRLRPM